MTEVDPRSVPRSIVARTGAGAAGEHWSLRRAIESSLARDVLLASSVALVLGLIRLGAPSFWVDEAATARAIDRSLPSLVDRQYHVLYYALMKPWAAVAGTSEWSLRFLSVVGTMAACGLLVVLARRLVGRWTALTSGLLLAASPFVVKWSQQARSYTWLLAVSLLAMLALMRALDRGSRAAWAAYGISFSVLVVWHPVSGVLLVPAHAALIAQGRERVLPHGLLAAVLVGAIAVPWAAVTAIRSTGEGVAMNWLTAPTPAGALRALLDVSGASGLGVLLALLGLWVIRRTGRVDLATWLGVWAFSPFVVALAVTLVRPVYLDRYLIVAAPAFAILAAIAITGVGRRGRTALIVAVAVACGAGLVRWYASDTPGNWRGEDWRSAVRMVLDRRSKADAIVVAPWSAAPAARYYGADVVDVSTADSIWVLTWSETGEDITRAERRALGFGDHVRVEKDQFGWRVSAQLWRRPG